MNGRWPLYLCERCGEEVFEEGGVQLGAVAVVDGDFGRAEEVGDFLDLVTDLYSVLLRYV